MLSVAIIGLGGRGLIYAREIKKMENAKLVAVCDVDASKLKLAQGEFGVLSNMLFSSEEQFFSSRLADVLIVSTQDIDHCRHTLPALELGYDVLLEKPIATSKEECELIASKANQLGRRVAVCHVLRYSDFFMKVKEIVQSGAIGDIVTLNQTENVGYWHQAHSYVRGSWRNSGTSAPMILAKCCHDLDIIKWLIDKSCTSISSYGGLTHFVRENSPSGSADYCFECHVPCIYNCIDFYKEHCAWVNWADDEELKARLYNPCFPYSRCVYKCDNDVVDHQVVNMLFENGATAHLTMTAFSKDTRRTIKIHGTRGELVGDMGENSICVTRFGMGGECEPSVNYQIKVSEEGQIGHGGGDARLMQEFVSNIEGNKGAGLTDINLSVESHLMAFFAEESRVLGGKPISVKRQNNA